MSIHSRKLDDRSRGSTRLKEIPTRPVRCANRWTTCAGPTRQVAALSARKCEEFLAIRRDPPQMRYWYTGC